MIWVALAWRLLWNQRRFSTVIIANLSLGLLSYASLDAVKESMRAELSKGSKRFLSADLLVQVNNRDFNNNENTVLAEELDRFESTQVTTLFSMAATEDLARLVSIQAIGNKHPLYGRILFDSGEEITSTHSFLAASDPTVWLTPEIATQLDIGPGDQIRLGAQNFRATEIVVEDSGDTGSAFNLAPKVYIDRAWLDATKLIQPGSRFNQKRLYRLDEKDNVEAIVERLQAILTAPEIRIRSHTDASDNLARAFTLLTDYLGLVALIALFLAGLGTSYLFRSHLIKQLQPTAILNSIGATASEARLVIIAQILILGCLAALVALGSSLLVFPVVPRISAELLPFALVPRLSWTVVGVTLALASVGSLLICLPLLQGMSQTRPAVLFQETSQFSLNLKWWHSLWNLPAALLYWWLSVIQAQSYVIGSLFFAAIAAAVVLFSILSTAIFQTLPRFWRTPDLSAQLALRYLSRNHFATASSFLAIGVGTMLVALVPQLHDLITREITNPPGYKLPDFFLLDIQDDQIDDMSSFLSTDFSTQIQNLSPMVRARLTGVKGEDVRRIKAKPSQGTRESQRARWSRMRGQNLTYGSTNKASEAIVAGREFSGSYDWEQGGPAEISVEQRYAKRLGVVLGDELRFDVQGIDIRAKVVSIRRVKWTSFQPNFFIKFQTGVLEDAPKMSLATVSGIAKDSQTEFQQRFVRAFPNISLIDVSRTIKRILVLVGKMRGVIEIMALFAFAAGFVVLFSLAQHQAQQRRGDLNLLKILGAKEGLLTSSVLIEFGLVGAAAAFAGCVASSAVSYLFARFVFFSPWVPDLTRLAIVMAAISIVSTAVAYLAARRTMSERPALILSS